MSSTLFYLLLQMKRLEETKNGVCASFLWRFLCDKMVLSFLLALVQYRICTEVLHTHSGGVKVHVCQKSQPWYCPLLLFSKYIHRSWLSPTTQASKFLCIVENARMFLWPLKQTKATPAHHILSFFVLFPGRNMDLWWRVSRASVPIEPHHSHRCTST